MLIGVPKERLDGERRVAITPETCQLLVNNGFTIHIETEAGLGCGFTDIDYINCGATVCAQHEIWEAPVIVKVKEPVSSEYNYFKNGQTVIGFLHLAANPKCVQAMVAKEMTAIACENIVVDGKFELLKPVSEIAGRKALFTAISLLEQNQGGKGMLLSGTSVAKPGVVSVVGGGVVGQNAAEMANAIGATVRVFDINDQVIEDLNDKCQGTNITAHKSSSENLLAACEDSDVLISTVLIPGSSAPKIVTTEMVGRMAKGSVIIDVSSDQGGSVEPAKKRTTHSQPTYEINGVVYYGVPNMPAAVPKTATESIQGIFEILNQAKDDYLNDERVISGLQVMNGQIINKHLEEL